jgi:activator of 2-hydroxyglutaryl-CoA dehydratase
MKEFYIGIDVGSVSTNVVAVDNSCNVLSKQYIRTNGQPLESVRQGLRCLRDEFESNARVLGWVLPAVEDSLQV